MTLTSEQLTILRSDLDTLVQLNYAHLRDELLDHYAILTEEKMDMGWPFQEAHAAAWQALGEEKGIRQIQIRYERITKQQLRTRYYTILKRLFYWPTVATTLLIGCLLVSLLLTLPQSLARLMMGFMVLSPLLVILLTWLAYRRTNESRNKLAWQFISRQSRWPGALLSLLNLFVTDSSRDGGLAHQLSLFIIAGASLLIAVGLAQLMREHFSFKLT